VFPSAPQEAAGWGARERYLQRLIQEAAARGERRIDLQPEDLESLSNPVPAPLPDAFHVIAQIAASSPDELLKERNGRYQVRILSASGPSGARLLGRFCHLDGDILNGVRAHIEGEESLRPEAVFAEVVHLPEGRIGNVLARPVLRPYEIPFLGRPSVESEYQIPLSDLRVSIVSGRVVLTSERLDREVIPRLTTAHNFVSRTLGVYRFLGALQAQGTVGSLLWNWGPLESLPFLPRVTMARLVLERARWNIPADEIKALADLDGAGLLREVRAWRERRGLPRHLVLAVFDNELPLDLENIVNVESFLDEAHDRSWVVLHELFPGPEDTWLEGPEGHFVHELVVPFMDRSRKDAIRAPRRATPSIRVRRDFPPGSEWLFAKLYTGTATADAVLRETVAPLVRSTLASGDADTWFFIRYSDPEWHLRVRLHGDPEALNSKVLPALQREASSLLDRHLIWRFQLDTYQREVSRYGGPEAIESVERLFWSDSEAALGIIEALQGEQAAGERWRLAVRGIDLLLSDLGFDLPGKTRVVRAMREGYTREFRADLRLKKQLGARQRELREEVERLLQPEWNDQEPLAPAFELLEKRSRHSAPALADIAALERSGRLQPPREELASSLIHMHVNRLLRAEGRAHELILSEMLLRCYTAQTRRTGPGQTPPMPH
jgi:thiopeptide-type bacteriocin biosynthesis protein